MLSMSFKINGSIRTSLAAIALSAFAVTLAYGAPPAKTATTSKGPTLVDAKGMTLYTFDKDTDGKSACNGACATNWPALKAESGAQPADDYTIIARDDGTLQWAYKGKPLYTWTKDTKPGDTTGDGFLNGAWHVAQP